MPLTLLSLASRQIWPQVLAVAHLNPKPSRILLLHSDDAAESKGPAQRVKRFFDASGLVPPGTARMEPVSDTDFAAIERRLDEIQVSHQLPLAECVLNFTGGNKLMAMAAFRWAAKRGVRTFYLERRNQVTWFEPREGEMTTRLERVDGHLTDDLDPVELLRCQLDASVVERPGQKLTLNDPGRTAAGQRRFEAFTDGADPRAWLLISGEADREDKEGDRLEFTVAAVLLALGVKQVQRSLRLKVKSSHQVSTRSPHAEIDLLFVWDGRLWLVDCKDRRPVEDLASSLRRLLKPPLHPQADKLLGMIQSQLAIGQIKALKEDLLAVREAGGLLGSVVCARAAELPGEVLQFARLNGIAVVVKRELVAGFQALLFPTEPANLSDLADLQARFTPRPQPSATNP